MPGEGIGQMAGKDGTIALDGCGILCWRQDIS